MISHIPRNGAPIADRVAVTAVRTRSNIMSLALSEVTGTPLRALAARRFTPLGCRGGGLRSRRTPGRGLELLDVQPRGAGMAELSTAFRRTSIFSAYEVRKAVWVATLSY
ncbi:hypothetical protein GCM10022248_89860 [Nonomuraea soli]